MTIEWEHQEESDIWYESWKTELRGVHLLIEYVTEGNVFIWTNNLTGSAHRVSASTTLDIAMSQAIASVE